MGAQVMTMLHQAALSSSESLKQGGAGRQGPNHKGFVSCTKEFQFHSLSKVQPLRYIKE